MKRASSVSASNSQKIHDRVRQSINLTGHLLSFTSKLLKYLQCAVILIGLCTFNNCSNKNDIPAFPAGTFSPIASINANISFNEPFSTYEAEYKAIRNTGATGVQTAAPWKSLNPTGTTYDLTLLSNSFFGLGALSDYGYENIFLNIPIITIDQRSMPADISSLPFDDQNVKNRYRALIDVVKGQINSRVKYISLGNEVDTYLVAHPNEWPSFKNLIDDLKPYIKSNCPGVNIGVTITFEGATGSNADLVKTLTSNMDVNILTYYPIGNKFSPREPSTVKPGIEKMIAIANGKAIIMQEWGYPSSTALGSSEIRQAEFIYNSLVEIEKKGPIVFPFVSFFKFRDWNADHVRSITGQTSGQPFYEFMSSLGVNKNDGNPKQAFTVLKSWIKN